MQKALQTTLRMRQMEPLMMQMRPRLGQMIPQMLKQKMMQQSNFQRRMETKKNKNQMKTMLATEWHPYVDQDDQAEEDQQQTGSYVQLQLRPFSHTFKLDTLATLGFLLLDI